MVKAAARAVAFCVDPDNAIMFPEAAASDEALRAGTRKPIDLPSRLRDRNEVLAVRLWSRESGSIPQVALPHADGRAPRFVVAHEWKVKESVGADVLGGPQPQSNANRVVGRLRAAEDVRPYRRHRGSLG